MVRLLQRHLLTICCFDVQPGSTVQNTVISIQSGTTYRETIVSTAPDGTFVVTLVIERTVQNTITGGTATVTQAGPTVTASGAGGSGGVASFDPLQLLN